MHPWHVCFSTVCVYVGWRRPRRQHCFCQDEPKPEELAGPLLAHCRLRVIVMTNHIHAAPKFIPPELAMFALFLCGTGLVFLAMKKMMWERVIMPSRHYRWMLNPTILASTSRVLHATYMAILPYNFSLFTCLHVWDKVCVIVIIPGHMRTRIYTGNC